MPEAHDDTDAAPGEHAGDGPRWSRIVPVVLIVLLPTLVVAFVVFGTGQNHGPGYGGPATAAPVVAGGRSATSELLASLDPALGCTATDQTTIAHVNQLFASGRLNPARIPAPLGAVTCTGGGIVRDYVAFSRAEDARSLFDAAGAATAADVGTGPGDDCRHLVAADVVLLTCSSHPEIVWSARARGLTGTAILEQLGR